MSATQRVTGLSSGFDTQSIVDQLMKLEKIPYDKLDVKKQTQQLKLQAYQAVNSMFLKFKTSVNTLSSQKLWKAKSASTTNDKVLTATANEYAVNGSYSFKVAQLATAAQFMTKGFASSKTAFVKQQSSELAYKIGSISLNSAKSRVDTSAKLDVLNGGKGVYRGSVRVTDASGSTSIIDLSSCDTMDDAVRTLNGSTNAQINASIKDGRLYIEDASGGGGAVKIQNVGTGTTATDLGIAGIGGENGGKALWGRNVYTMGNDTALSTLQDGLGIEEGVFYLRVAHNADSVTVAVNVDDCATVGDITKRVNTEIEAYSQDPAVAGRHLLNGLKFGISDDKTSFSLTGTTAGYTYQFYDKQDANAIASQAPATQLGLTGSYSVSANDEVVNFSRALGGADSPMIKNLSGVNGGGLGSANTSNNNLVSVPFDQDTKVSALNGGKGINVAQAFQIMFSEGGEDVSNSSSLVRIFDDILNPAKLNTIANDPDATVGELVDFMNQSLAQYAADPGNNAAGLTGMYIDVDKYNGNLYIAGAQTGYQVEIAGTLAYDLGLTRYAGAGTAIKNDWNSGAQTAIESFYGLDGSSVDLLGNNKTIQLAAVAASGSNPAKPATTLFDLAALHGLDISDPGNLPTAADVLTALTGAFGDGKMTMSMTGQFVKDFDGSGNPLYTAPGTTISATVDVNDLTFDSTTTVADFMDQLNQKITDAFHDASAAVNGGTPFDVSAPQLRVSTYANGLQWSNVDFSKSFSASGDLADAFGVDKSIALAAADKTHPPDALVKNLNPMEVGYVAAKDFTSSNANQIELHMLNNGSSLTFAGAGTDTIDFDLGVGKTFSITMDELRSALNALPTPHSGLNATLDDYVGVLNSLVSTKLFGSGASFQFQVGANKLEIANLTGADHLIISGAGADAVKTGISAVNEATPPASAFGLATLKAGEITTQAIKGLGNVRIQLGTGTAIDLETDGLSGDSTLQQLIDKLNSELAKHVGTDPEFANVSFKINDAGTGIAITNDSGKAFKVIDTKDAQSLASDLGLIDKAGNGVKVDSYSHHNAGSLGRKYLGRATSLAGIMGGPNVPIGVMTVTNASGVSQNIDLSEAKTVGDVIDAINGLSSGGFGVMAALNERGDGITIFEAYPNGAVPNPPPTGNISIADHDDGTLAKKLGIAGTGNRVNNFFTGASVIEGSMKSTIDVMSSDTLESLMYRISELGYKTAIVNDGSSSNPYRLTLSSTTTGEASDFVIESDLEMFGFHQTSRGKDSKVLYGDPNSGASPTMLSSSTNSNANAILGLTLDLKSVSDTFTTITVDTNKEKVVEEIKNLVQTYNDTNDLVSYLDAYDPETNEPGILFGDTSIRKLMEEINEMFYQIYNPDQKSVGSVNDKGVQNTWTWMDLGVSLSAKQTNTGTSGESGNWYSSMDLDLDSLNEMVAKNWDTLYLMLAGQRNASNSTLDKSVRASASFNGKVADGFSADNAINGDTSKSSWGVNNGVMADGTIAQGENEYTIYFQKPTTMSRMSIYHQDSSTALKNFSVEYLDTNTGKWETLRDISNNSVDANHLGLAMPTTVSAVRIKASSTNATDGKFRLLDVQVFEDTGLAGQLNQLTTRLGDTQEGFLAERDKDVSSNIADLDEQMARLQERMDMKEQSLWRRFTAMESALGQLQNQSSYFSSMMDSLGSGSKKK